MQKCGYSKRINESDSFKMVFLIRDQNDTLLEEYFILDDPKRLLNKFPSFKCIFYPRATNKVTHVLAHEKFKSRVTSVWLEDGRFWLSKVLKDDISN